MNKSEAIQIERQKHDLVAQRKSIAAQVRETYKPDYIRANPDWRATRAWLMVRLSTITAKLNALPRVPMDLYLRIESELGANDERAAAEAA